MKPQVWVGESKPDKNKMAPVKDEYYFVNLLSYISLLSISIRWNNGKS